MNDNYLDQDFCYRHPNHAIVGVCHFCLNDKLLALAANQIRRPWEEDEKVSKTCHGRKVSNVGRSNFFAFGTLIETLRLRNHRRNSDCEEDDGIAAASDKESNSASHEDSFISIQFEEDGVASWDKSRVSNVSEQERVVLTKPPCEAEKEGYIGENMRKSVMVQHKSCMSRGSMRWRKRIGHLFQLVRWKRSSKAKGATSSHANGVFGFGKVRSRGWIGALTKRRSSN